MHAMVFFFKFQAKAELHCRYFPVNLFKSFPTVIFIKHLRTTTPKLLERGVPHFDLFPIAMISSPLILLFFSLIILDPNALLLARGAPQLVLRLYSLP